MDFKTHIESISIEDLSILEYEIKQENKKISQLSTSLRHKDRLDHKDQLQIKKWRAEFLDNYDKLNMIATEYTRRNNEAQEYRNKYLEI